MRVTPEFPPVKIFGGSETDKISRCINSSPNLSEYQMRSLGILSNWISSLSAENFEFRNFGKWLLFDSVVKLKFLQKLLWRTVPKGETNPEHDSLVRKNVLNEVQNGQFHIASIVETAIQSTSDSMSPSCVLRWTMQWYLLKCKSMCTYVKCWSISILKYWKWWNIDPKLKII